MQTYSYLQLSVRSKDMAYARYGNEIVQDLHARAIEPTWSKVIEELGAWRFDEHGYRIG